MKNFVKKNIFKLTLPLINSRDKYIIKSLLEWNKGKKGFPTQVQLHLTNYCNLKCLFCPTRALLDKGQLDRKKELTKERWFEIIEEGTRLGVKEWHICGGGEPMFFTNESLLIMERIKESKGYGEIITNGTFLGSEVAKRLVEMNWDMVYISLDAPDAEIQNFLRGTECFKKIIQGVKNLVSWKRKLKSKKPLLKFHMVVCNKNYRMIPGMIELADKLGVDEVLLNALNIWKPEINKLKLNRTQEQELNGILRVARRLALKFGIKTNIDDFLSFNFVEKANIMNEAMKEEHKTRGEGLLSVPCYYPWYNISIFADGRSLPCFILKDEGESVKEKSLKEVWLGSYFEEIRRMFLKNELKEDCSKCNPWNLPKMKEIRNELRSMLA